MKILLVKSTTLFFPIGLLYLASELESQGIDVSILDYVTERYTPQKFKSKIIEINPNIVGINCLSSDTKSAFDIAGIVKEALPHSHVIMGGPHPTGLPEHTLKNKNIDSVVIGEGEKTLSELVGALDKGSALKDIKGLAYKDDDKIIINPPREPIKNCDSILFPAYHLINLDSYFEYPISPFGIHGTIPRHPRFMHILTSRGCPYSCTYCHNIFGKIFRPRSPENILGEMEMLYDKYNIREFIVEDDSFNIDLDRAEKILDLIIKANLKISIQFPNGLRADRINERFVKKLKEAGTFMVAIGIESASPDTLRRVKKNLDLNDVPKAINLLVKYGILVWGYFMIGFLDETREEIEQTIDFAKRSNLHFASFSIVVPFPGTELFGQVKNRINLDSALSRGINQEFPQVQLSKLSLEEIGKIKKEASNRFYTPIRIFRIAKTINNFSEIKYYWAKFRHYKLKPYLRKKRMQLLAPLRPIEVHKD